MERGFTSKSGAGGAGVVFLWIGLEWMKSLGMSRFETYEFERFEL